MAKIIITVEDLPVGDPKGNVSFHSSSEPGITAEQLAGKAEFTTAQQVGNVLLNIAQRLMMQPAVVGGAEVIDVAPNAEGTLEVAK